MLTVRKNKVVLSDYNYKRDIENRILFSELTKQEVEILKEIVDSSITFTIQSLSDNLNLPLSQVTQALHKISNSKLLTINKEVVTVDKELRKYFEFHLKKFDADFEVSMEYIQSILARVPPHVLPNWYQITRTSDSIFTTILDKYLLYPKLFEKYLFDLQFDNSIIDGIIRDVYSSPDFRMESTLLCEKYQLSRAQFYELMLHIEYNFMGFLKYEEAEDRWIEVVTPAYEWREYLIQKRDSYPKPIVNTHEIKKFEENEFQFLRDINTFLRACYEESLPFLTKSSFPTLDSKVLTSLFPRWEKMDKNELPLYFSRIVAKAQLLHAVEMAGKKFVATKETMSWLDKNLSEQAMILFRHPMNRLSSDLDLQLVTEKNLREAEKSLKSVAKLGWVYFDDFIQGLTVPIGMAEPVTLKCKGKKWKYVFPSYSQQEKVLIEAVISERLFEVGMTSIGEHEGRRCFCVTPFGRLALGE